MKSVKLKYKILMIFLYSSSIYSMVGVCLAEDFTVKGCEIFQEHIASLNRDEADKFGPDTPVKSEVDCKSLSFNLTLVLDMPPNARTKTDFYNAVKAQICSEGSDWPKLFASGWSVGVKVRVKMKELLEIGALRSCS